MLNMRPLDAVLILLVLCGGSLAAYRRTVTYNGEIVVKCKYTDNFHPSRDLIGSDVWSTNPIKKEMVIRVKKDVFERAKAGLAHCVVVVSDLEEHMKKLERREQPLAEKQMQSQPRQLTWFEECKDIPETLIGPSANIYYYITSKLSGGNVVTVDKAADGSKVYMNSTRGTLVQKWVTVPGTITGSTIFISAASGKPNLALDGVNGSGQQLVLTPCDANGPKSSQQWITNSDSSFTLANSDLVMDVQGASPKDGIPAILWPKNNPLTDNEKFYLVASFSYSKDDKEVAVDKAENDDKTNNTKCCQVL